MNNVDLIVVGWRDPAYLASSDDGFAIYGKPYTKSITIDDNTLKSLLDTGFIEVDGDNICIDYEEVNSHIYDDVLVFNDCILFIPTFAFDCDECIDEDDFFEDSDN